MRFKSFDYTLIVVPLLLAIFGVVMIYSASIYSSVELYGVKSEHFFSRQLISLTIGVFAFAFFANFNYKHYKSNILQIPMVIGMILVLIAVEQFGTVVNGSVRWFKLGSFTVQPTEFVKLGLILYMASVFHKKQRYIDEINRALMPPVIVLLCCVLLIMRQPDWGTAGIMLVASFFVILSSGMNWRKISLLLAILMVCIMTFATLAIKYPDTIFSEGKTKRFIGFLQPFETEQQEGYHVVGSLIAIGSGKMTGTGFAQSTQKYGYLPEVHTDSIIAIIAEEFGFIGVAGVLACLGFIVLKGILIATRCKDPFGSMLAIGISSTIGFQAFVNLGGMTSMLPITGVTLPLVSYGGTSLILTFISIGILVNISMQTEGKRLMAEAS